MICAGASRPVMSSLGKPSLSLLGMRCKRRPTRYSPACNARPAQTVEIVRAIAQATGTVDGMIGGQVMDLEAEEHKPTPELVEAIHRAKTGALIRVSLVSGGIYAGGDRGRY